ncbi:hypothetical protein E6W17_30705 [Streptomyces sp. A1547]|nr:hypothetical protein E6W17_30705 [Streptomyces sp. A1547]
MGVLTGTSVTLQRTFAAAFVRLRCLRLTERLTAVPSTNLDVALVRALPAAPELELLPVSTDPLYVALPDGHPLTAEPALHLEQLAHLPLRLAPRRHPCLARGPPLAPASRRPDPSAASGGQTQAGDGPVVVGPVHDPAEHRAATIASTLKCAWPRRTEAASPNATLCRCAPQHAGLPRGCRDCAGCGGGRVRGRVRGW